MQYLAHHIVSLPCTYTLIRNSISIIENACSQNHYFPLKYSNLPLLSNPASYLPFFHFPPPPPTNVN